MTGERYVIWRDQSVVGPVISRTVVDEIDQMGLLTEKRRELSRSERARAILKSITEAA